VKSIPHQELTGIGASPGIAIGKAYIHRVEPIVMGPKRIAQSRVPQEVDRFLNALRQVGDEIRRTRRMVEMEHGSDLALIFDAQLAMLEDAQIKDVTVERIEGEQLAAERAFESTMVEIKESFERIENEYLRARITDVRDIEHQVLAWLAEGELQGLRSLRSNTVVVARDLAPSEAAHLGRRLVKGVVLDGGGATSHTSIIARSLGLPAVVGTERASREIQPGDLIIVDGNEGVVLVRPGRDALRHYSNELRRQLRRQRELSTHRDLPAVTLDGVEVTLLANLDLPQETQMAVDSGAAGVGMFRTEFLYLGYALPTEDEQVAAYRQIVKAMTPRPVTIRTIDLGGDKLAHAVETTPEANPFLGWRGIRMCLDTPELFKTQLRAILRSGASGEVQILLPMISSVEEVRRTRQMVEEARQELRAQGRSISGECKIGVMVEVPSAAIMADHLAQEADFFSLGTNDLVQYTLAVDRGTGRVSPLYDPLHPAVLKLIKMVIESGCRHRIPVSICGEMAGDPLVTVVLLGLGLRILSMGSGSIAEVREVVRQIRLTAARDLAEECLELDSAAAVRQRVQAAAPHAGGAPR